MMADPALCKCETCTHREARENCDHCFCLTDPGFSPPGYVYAECCKCRKDWTRRSDEDDPEQPEAPNKTAWVGEKAYRLDSSAGLTGITTGTGRTRFVEGKERAYWLDSRCSICGEFGHANCGDQVIERLRQPEVLYSLHCTWGFQQPRG